MPSTTTKPRSSRPAHKAGKRRPIDIDTLWQLQRVGLPALSPDGRHAVVSVATPSMADNSISSALWLLPTAPGARPAQQPRQLTHCGSKDGQPAWSPQGDRIAFLARREQQGSKDAAAQLYVMAPDGGEARRVSDFAPGIASFKWLPDGRRIAFTAWVWPELKGAKAQNKRHAEFSARKESGYATSAAYYRYWDDQVPQGRVLHLLLLDVGTEATSGPAGGRITDLFEGTPYELPRDASGNDVYDVHPDGRRIAFVHDPAAEPRISNPLALAEIDIPSRRVRVLLDDPAWSIAAPRYRPNVGPSVGPSVGPNVGPKVAPTASPTASAGAGLGGVELAVTAAHVGRQHTALQQLALLTPTAPAAGGQPGLRLDVRGADWDHDIDGPLHWTPDGSALLFTAEARGRRHLWRHDVAAGSFSVVHAGGTVQGVALATAAGAAGQTTADTVRDSVGANANGTASATAVVAVDSALHPTRVFALQLTQPGVPAQRIEAFNDPLLQTLAFGDVREVEIQGALGDGVQLWLTFPPGFDPKKKHPVLHMIHGGPYAAAGDNFSLRWNPHVFAAPPHGDGKAGKDDKDKAGKPGKRARGQVVAQVNFHGSSGFGLAFRHSLIGRQGELELQDIEAATDWLLAQPWADATRVTAAGGSYGGFLVAWMNGHVPAWPAGRYRAYVCHAGVFDRIATFSADSYPERPKDLAANYWEDMPRVLAQSPHAFAGAMAAPTLVTHGARDFRVPDCNGLAYYNTLKARGVDARLLWFPDENHWVLKPQNARLWSGEFQAWIARHTGKTAVTAGSKNQVGPERKAKPKTRPKLD